MKAQGYCKTSFAYERDAETQVDTWQIIEDQEELDNEYLMSDKTTQMVIIVHPMYSIAEEDAKNAAVATTTPAQTQQQQIKAEAVANLAIKEKQEKQDDLSSSATDGIDHQEDSDIEKEADYTVAHSETARSEERITIDPADI